MRMLARCVLTKKPAWKSFLAVIKASASNVQLNLTPVQCAVDLFSTSIVKLKKIEFKIMLLLLIIHIKIIIILGLSLDQLSNAITNI